MAVGDIFRVTAQFTMPESTIAQWVWHYQQVNSGVTAPSLLILAIEDNLELAWAEIDQMIDPEVVGDTLELAIFDNVANEFDTIRTVDISQLVGIATSEMLPHQEAGIVKFSTDVGRSVGKKFVFGISENQQDNSILIAGAITALVNFALQFDDTVTDGAATYAPGNYNIADDLFRQWTGTVTANALLGTMDRRRPGVGI